MDSGRQAPAGSSGIDRALPPGVSVLASGRTIHLKAAVVDIQQELFPGFVANLWGFCFGPADAGDAVSAAAVEPWTALPGDAVVAAPAGMSCSVPGPTLRVRQGDRVIVDLQNDHMHAHSIHWHGQLVPWQADGAPGVSQDSVVNGGTFTYDFVAKKAGTLWYHCHVDGQHHIMKGLHGAIIVEPADAAQDPVGIGREYVWVLATANRAEVMQVAAVPMSEHAGHLPTCLSGQPGCVQPPSAAGVPDIFLINGHSAPLTMEQRETVLNIRAGERIRLRIVNAGEELATIHPHGHDMLITHRDGNVLPAVLRTYEDTLAVGPGQRVDVVLSGDNPGPWMVHTHVSSHLTNCHRSGGGMHGMLVYEGFENHMHDFEAELPATCDPMNAPSPSYEMSKILGMT